MKGAGEKRQGWVVGLPRTRRGTGISVSARALVRVGAGRGMGSLRPKGVKKVRQEVDLRAGRKVRQWKGRGVHWELLRHGPRGLVQLLLFLQDLGGEGGSPPPPRRASS